MAAWLCLLAGSAAGGAGRWALSRALSGAFAGRLPAGTLAVNLSGCLLMGLLSGLSRSRGLSEPARLALMTGFCGGYTTLSALALEASGMLDGGRRAAALLYAAGTALAGLALLRLGESWGGPT